MIARTLRYSAAVGLCANSLFLALYILLPMAITGGMEFVEPNRVLRWAELSSVLALTVLGIVQTVFGYRRERRK